MNHDQYILGKTMDRTFSATQARTQRALSKETRKSYKVLLLLHFSALKTFPANAKWSLGCGSEANLETTYRLRAQHKLQIQFKFRVVVESF